MNFNLTEISRNLIQDAIKANIASALQDVRSDRGDALVSTEPPAKYYIYVPERLYQLPAIVTFVTDIDFMKERFNANHINATIHMQVYVIVEDRILDNLIIKSERYMSALYGIIDQKEFISSDNQVKIYSIVHRASFSDEYKEGDIFRKQVLIDLNIRHFEKLFT